MIGFWSLHRPRQAGRFYRQPLHNPFQCHRLRGLMQFCHDEESPYVASDCSG